MVLTIIHNDAKVIIRIEVYGKFYFFLKTAISWERETSPFYFGGFYEKENGYIGNRSIGHRSYNMRLFFHA